MDDCTCRRCVLDDYNREMAKPGPLLPYFPERFICAVCDQPCDHAMDHRVDCPFRKWGNYNRFIPIKKFRRLKL